GRGHDAVRPGGIEEPGIVLVVRPGVSHRRFCSDAVILRVILFTDQVTVQTHVSSLTIPVSVVDKADVLPLADDNVIEYTHAHHFTDFPQTTGNVQVLLARQRITAR